MDIEKLRYFRVVAQEEHMTRAAQKINITQPALSTIIASIENELGVKLFKRVGRQIMLNSYGAVFAESVDFILSKYDGTLTKLSQMKEGTENSVTLAVTGVNFSQRIIAALANEYPDIQINIVLIRGDEIISTLKQSESRFVLSSILYEDSTTKALEIFEESMYLAVSSAHPLSAKNEISLEDLKEERFTLSPKNTAYRVLTDEFFAKAGYMPKVRMEAYNEQLLLSVQQNLAVAIVSEAACLNYPYKNKIHFLKLTDAFCKRKLWLLYKTDVQFSDSEQTFFDFIYYDKDSFL